MTDPSGSKKKAAAAAGAAAAATAAARTKSLMGKKPYKTHNAVMQSLLRTKVITLLLEWNKKIPVKNLYSSDLEGKM